MPTIDFYRMSVFYRIRTENVEAVKRYTCIILSISPGCFGIISVQKKSVRKQMVESQMILSHDRQRRCIENNQYYSQKDDFQRAVLMPNVLPSYSHGDTIGRLYIACINAHGRAFFR